MSVLLAGTAELVVVRKLFRAPVPYTSPIVAALAATNCCSATCIVGITTAVQQLLLWCSTLYLCSGVLETVLCRELRPELRLSMESVRCSKFSTCCLSCGADGRTAYEAPVSNKPNYTASSTSRLCMLTITCMCLQQCVRILATIKQHVEHTRHCSCLKLQHAALVSAATETASVYI